MCDCVFYGEEQTDYWYKNFIPYPKMFLMNFRHRAKASAYAGGSVPSFLPRQSSIQSPTHFILKGLCPSLAMHSSSQSLAQTLCIQV